MASPATKNIKKLYLLTVLTNLWFATASWLYFYRLYMSDQQIGILDGIVFGIGIIAEVPSGALADILGRKRQLRLGLLLMAGGFLLQGFAQSYWYILAGMMLFVVGTAFVSGSDDALVYDSLHAERKSSRWKAIITRKFQIKHMVTIASFLIGGLLYVWHFRLPFIVSGIGALVAFCVASSFEEMPRARQRLQPTMYITQAAQGMRYLFRRHMLIYAYMALVVLGAGYAFDIGVIKPLMLDMFGFTANAQAIINTVAGVTAALALTQLVRLRRVLGERRGLMILAALIAAGFFAASYPIAGFGLLAFLIIFTANVLAEPWFNDVVQHEVPSSHRATALSTLALLQKLPYVALGPIAGAMAFSGTLAAFFWGLAICLFAAICLLLAAGILQKRSQRYVSTKLPAVTLRDDQNTPVEDLEGL